MKSMEFDSDIFIFILIQRSTERSGVAYIEIFINNFRVAHTTIHIDSHSDLTKNTTYT